MNELPHGFGLTYVYTHPVGTAHGGQITFTNVGQAAVEAAARRTTT